MVSRRGNWTDANTLVPSQYVGREVTRSPRNTGMYGLGNTYEAHDKDQSISLNLGWTSHWTLKYTSERDEVSFHGTYDELLYLEED